MYSVYCTVYIVQCILYTVNCILYNVQCILYSVYCTVYSVCVLMYILQCLCTVYNEHIHYVMCITVPHTSLQCTTVCNLHYTVYNVHMCYTCNTDVYYTLCNVYRRLFSVGGDGAIQINLQSIDHRSAWRDIRRRRLMHISRVSPWWVQDGQFCAIQGAQFYQIA